MTEREYFYKNATILYDTREQQNFDVLAVFNHYGLKTERVTFQTADYSFLISGKDYRKEWLAERKGSLTEVYGNVMAKNLDETSDLRNNIEEELKRAKLDGVTELIIFLQGARNLGEVKHYINPKAGKQGMNAGLHIYSTLTSWACNNRYGFKVVCRLTQKEIAEEMLNMAFYFWRNEQKALYGDNFLKILTKGE